MIKYWPRVAGNHERFRLLFATSDDAALIDIGQELAPAFFIRLSPHSVALFESLQEHTPEIVVIDLDTIAPDGQDVFAYVESVRAAAPQVLFLVISRTPCATLDNARRRQVETNSSSLQ